MGEKPLIVVTGSSGRIGSEVIKRFSGKYSIVGLDFVPPKEPPVEYKYIPTDVSQDIGVQKAFEQIKQEFGNKIAAFIHLAAYYNFGGGEWDHYEKITIKGTERILIALQQFECSQFLFSSTMLVHAPTTPGHPLTENSPLLGSWEYPQSKIITEERIHILGKMPTVILRIAGVYDDYCNSIPISNQIQRIYEKQLESHLFPGNIHHGDSYLHMDDLIDSICLAVEKRDQLPKKTVLLIGETEVLSYDQLQREISLLLYGKEITTLQIPKWVAKGGAYMQNHLPMVHASFIKPWMIDLADQHYELDTSLARELLTWQAKKTLKNTLPKMIAALKKDPLEWYEHHELTPPSWLHTVKVHGK